MKKLILDLGNTNLKLFVFEQEQLIFNSTESDLNSLYKLIEECYIKYDIENVIVSSVREVDDLIKVLQSRFKNCIIVNPSLKFPVEIKYRSIATLGHDRIAAVCGASSLFPEENVLVIDAGTAITFDFLEQGKIYHGGSISPGINTRFKSLHNFTGKLPLLSINKDLNAKFGTTTEEAIILGVQNGISYEVEGIIEGFENEFENLVVVFTGGDSFFFEKLIKNRIFAEPNLIAFGLNKILEINV